MKLKDLLTEKIKGADGKACWDGYRYAGTEKGKDKCVKVSEHIVTFTKDDMSKLHKVGNLVKADSEGKDHTYVYDELNEFNMSTVDLLEVEVIDENITEAKYQGKTVPLNKPMRGDSKKFKVYDMRNIYSKSKIEAQGFKYFSVGN